MSRIKRFKRPICHPQRPLYAKGLCRQCSDAIRFGGESAREKTMLNIRDNYNASEALKEEFLRDARALVDSIRKYAKPPEAERRSVETRKPKVAEYVASVMVKNQLDSQRAVAEMKPELAPVEQAELAQRLEHDPNVQQAVEKQLEKRGLDEKSKERYLEILWDAAETKDLRREKEKLQALRILGRAFVPSNEHISVETPQELPIRGFAEGLKRMLGADADAANSDDASAFTASVKRPDEHAEFDA